MGDRASGSVGPARTAEGGWRQQGVYRTAGPFGDLVRALQAPPDTGGGDVECPAIMVAPFVITLTDAEGRTTTPAFPASSCGQPLPAVRQAVDALTWERVDPPAASRSD